MNTQRLMEALQASLNPQLALFLLLTAGYSLVFCIKDARVKNHQKAEKAARVGGWLYIVLAAAILTMNLF
ncbi:hypothetical protein SRRS_14500 [Sporomusa rhizae]|uniref:CLC_0170 family protein n=1 Tax=Sporomusa rhizae TaxID=357999 RepID=UPI00352A4CCF